MNIPNTIKNYRRRMQSAVAIFANRNKSENRKYFKRQPIYPAKLILKIEQRVYVGTGLWFGQPVIPEKAFMFEYMLEPKK